MKALARNFKRHLAIFLHFKKINFTERLAYRFNFVLIFSAVFLQFAFNLIFIKIIFSWVKDIHGWNYYEALLIVGTVLLIDGIMWSCFAFLHILRTHIRTGNLDGILTKPVDSQFLVSVYRGDLEDVVRVLTGLGVIVFALSHLALGWGPLTLNLFWYIILTFNSLVIIYSIAVMVNSISFWTIEASSSFGLLDSVLRSSQYPIDIFGNKILRYFFTFGIPLAFLATVPAKVLSQGVDFLLVLESVIVAAIFFIVSRIIWNRGLNKYSSASS